MHLVGASSFILTAALLIMFVLLKSIVIFIIGASMASLLFLEQWRRKILRKVIQGETVSNDLMHLIAE